ncbi:hypothetical protein C8R43DRAFT_1010440 [Mycena crocata]|nr:hypothetical protein C8R43DRAFT_1010440 [Mycena crocata]
MNVTPIARHLASWSHLPPHLQSLVQAWLFHSTSSRSSGPYPFPTKAQPSPLEVAPSAYSRPCRALPCLTHTHTTPPPRLHRQYNIYVTRSCRHIPRQQTDRRSRRVCRTCCHLTSKSALSGCLVLRATAAARVVHLPPPPHDPSDRLGLAHHRGAEARALPPPH